MAVHEAIVAHTALHSNKIAGDDPPPTDPSMLRVPVADIVAEWAGIHGEPFELVLDGPAGGKFTQGLDGESIEIDALDVIRTLSGRLPGTGVLSHPLPL